MRPEGKTEDRMRPRRTTLDENALSEEMLYRYIREDFTSAL